MSEGRSVQFDHLPSSKEILQFVESYRVLQTQKVMRKQLIEVSHSVTETKDGFVTAVNIVSGLSLAVILSVVIIMFRKEIVNFITDMRCRHSQDEIVEV